MSSGFRLFPSYSFFSTAHVRLYMFRANNDCFNGITLRDTDYVASTPLFNYGAYFTVEPFMRHTFLYARIHPYYHLRPRLVFLKYFANVWLALFSGWLSK